jgi:hypothetical protein
METLLRTVETVNQGCQIFIATAYQNGENIPKLQHIYQMALKCMYQMAVKYNNRNKIYRHPLQDPPKFTQTGIFCFENIPSGNPVRHDFLKNLPFLVERGKNTRGSAASRTKCLFFLVQL